MQCLLAAATNQFPAFLLALVVILLAARVLGGLARRIGQPAVLGELLAGVLVGPSVLGQIPGLTWLQVKPDNETLHLLAELGVVLLLFEIGLETDLGKLLAVGGASTAVALVGVVLPFLLGYLVCRALGHGELPSQVAGATLTATSVGITARVLAELGRLQDKESQIILGAAVLDDVLGLIILAVVSAQIGGEDVSTLQVLGIAGLAFGFLAVALLLGRVALPLLRSLADRLEPSATLPIVALIFACLLAYLANAVQPGLSIVGAFAAGLVLARLPQIKVIERGIAPIGHLIVPIFFVTTGAAVDVRLLNPFDPDNWGVLLVAGLVLVAAILGKVAAGYAPWWLKANKTVIGVGMVPRGEVGLIFANTGKSVVGTSLFSALTLLVMLTTFLVPPLLNLLLGKKPPVDGTEPPGPVGESKESPEPSGVEDLTNEP